MGEEKFLYYVVYASAVLGNLEWMVLKWPRSIDSESEIKQITDSLNREPHHNYVILNWKRID